MAPFLETPGALSEIATVPQGKLESSRTHELVLKNFRCFIADLCEQYNGGHPGGAMGMAAIGIALWRYAMRYSPNNPDYFNRDRFVLSNGHTCLLQYTFMHLVGYRSMTVDQLKLYHSDNPELITPGHPEIEHEGIEVTTGPLGQGVANSVGLAMATKQLGATYNKPDFEVVSNHTWCMIGDACLQEGVALEAVQFAGHLKLNNLTILYDNNQITCDGSVDMTCTEDINAKMRACGWKVIDVFDGESNVDALVQAMNDARSSDLPTFINIRTIIGVGSNVAGKADAHGVPFGREEVARLKESFGMDPKQEFVMPDEVYDFFRIVASKGDRLEADWKDLVSAYKAKYPEEGKEFELRCKGEMPLDWKEMLPSRESLPTKPLPSRKSSGYVLAPLAEKMKNFLIGTADLTPSVNLGFKGQVDFQNPDLRTQCGLDGDYTGRYIHYGIREHAMCGIANGLAAFNRGTFLPFTSTFFMFYIYSAASVRMGALQGLQVVHIGTHDSIGIGSDGPTHQPIALASLYRAMPNILYMRPCDTEEVVGAYTVALSATSTPSIISLSRQNLEQYPEHSRRGGVQRGAYVFIDDADADVTLIGVGSEMEYAVKTRDSLALRGLRARIVSFPCHRLFEKQPREYKSSVLRGGSANKEAPVVVIEAYSPVGWERYADAGINMGTFGKSLPCAANYRHFGFEPERMAEKIIAFCDEVKREGLASMRYDFRDLNGHLI